MCGFSRRKYSHMFDIYTNESAGLFKINLRLECLPLHKLVAPNLLAGNAEMMVFCRYCKVLILLSLLYCKGNIAQKDKV